MGGLWGHVHKHALCHKGCGEAAVYLAVLQLLAHLCQVTHVCTYHVILRGMEVRLVKLDVPIYVKERLRAFCHEQIHHIL